MNQPLCLHVLVMSATGLTKKDFFGLCDPYVKLSLRRGTKPINCQQTKTSKKTLNPQWNEKFVFNNISSQDSLWFEVFDANRLTRDNFLGKLHFKLNQIPIGMQKIDIYQYGNATQYPLKPKSRKSRVSGILMLKFLYYNDPPPRGSPGMGTHSLAQLVPGATGTIESQPRPQSRSPQSQPQPQPRPQSRSPQPQSQSQAQAQPHPLIQSQSQPARSVLPPPDGATAATTTVTPGPSQSSDDWVMVEHEERSDWVVLEEEEVEALPEHWEERMDANGRVFYVDHANHRTQWVRPTRASQESQGQRTAQLAAEQRRRLAQTLARRNPALENSSGLSQSMSALPIPNGRRSSADPTLGTGNSPRSTSRLSLTPSSSPTPPSPTLPLDDEELPPGWEKRLAPNGRPFYIDHNTRRTHWEAPSRPTNGGTSSRPVSMAISPSSSTSRLPSSQAGRGSLGSIESRDLGPLPAGWELRIKGGKQFFIDHNTRSTQWEDPRLIKLQKKAAAAVPYSRDYKQKYDSFRKSLLQRKPTDLPRLCEIPVRRNNIFEDSHRSIMGMKNRDHLKARLWVKFQGETGLDYGGVSREWFFLLSHEMLNPYYGLFEYSASDNYTLQVNPDSGFCNEHHIEYFRFIGRVLSMAIYHQKLIDAYFIRPFYKMLLGKKITLEDMEAVDTEFYNSIKYVLENDPEPLCLTFTASREFLGQVEEKELKPNGADIEVTDRNKKEYIDLLMKWRFEDRISKQMDAIKKGCNDIFPLRMLQIFDGRELEYLLCGLAEIQVADWKKFTVYANGYTANDDVIIWFWKAVANFDSEMRARLLQFATGTSKVPMNGFAELQGSNGPQKFCIKKLGEPSSLPRAHTCFNRIDLPPYRSYHELKEKLRLAIENTEGFEGVD